MKRVLIWLPLLVFGLLFLVVARGLFQPAERTVKSAMIGQPLPAFVLPPLVAGKAGVSSADFGNGEPRPCPRPAVAGRTPAAAARSSPI